MSPDFPVRLYPIIVGKRKASLVTVARLQEARGAGVGEPRADHTVDGLRGVLAVKKLLVLAVLALGGFLVWRKVQADRSELDLWTEATSADN